jgi:small subunit ribosomal protein S6
MPTYETVFAVPSILSEEEKGQSVKNIEEFITNFSGNINSSEGMGERKMAYKVKGHQRAYYHLIKFNLPAEAVDEMKKNYRINANTYIRNMIVKDEE